MALIQVIGEKTATENPHLWPEFAEFVQFKE